MYMYKEQQWKWFNVISITLFHIYSIYALILILFVENTKAMTYLWIYITAVLAGFGVTAGVHRLWCHRSYKATTAFRIFLAFCFSIAGQNTIYDWVRDHRVHHKFSDTDADPHNIRRGFWFSHVGWLMMTKHKDVIEKGRCIPMDDIVNDPVVKYHTMFFVPLKILLCFVLPTMIPIYMWNETVYIAILSQIFVRYPLTLNSTWAVNSAAHMWGNKPYNKDIPPSDNRIISFLAIGEGWHNYHHAFPYDYKTAEFGYSLNFTAFLLDLFAYFGLVYDRKQPSQKHIEKTALTYGDNTRYKTNCMTPEK